LAVTTSTMTDPELRQANVALVRHYLELWDVIDVEAVAETLHPDVELELGFPSPGGPEVMSGKAKVMEFLRAAPSAVGPMNFHAIKISTLENPNELVAEYRGDSVALQTQKPYRNRYITRILVKDGLIRHFCEYGNPLVHMEAFGPVPSENWGAPGAKRPG
jgi:ketosteroid isomerase-like protein